MFEQGISCNSLPFVFFHNPVLVCVIAVMHFVWEKKTVILRIHANADFFSINHCPWLLGVVKQTELSRSWVELHSVGLECSTLLEAASSFRSGHSLTHHLFSVFSCSPRDLYYTEGTQIIKNRRRWWETPRIPNKQSFENISRIGSELSFCPRYSQPNIVF